MDFFFFLVLGLSFGVFLGKSSVEMMHHELYVHVHNCHGYSLNVGVPYINPYFLLKDGLLS